MPSAADLNPIVGEEALSDPGAWGKIRGNKVVSVKGAWYYEDGEPLWSQGNRIERPCAECGMQPPTNDSPDPCLGFIPGVANACCGHGDFRFAYIAYDGDRPTERYESMYDDEETLSQERVEEMWANGHRLANSISPFTF